MWSHTPTNQTKQSSSGSCHLNSGFEQLINKAGQNLTPVTYTLDSYVLLLVCPPHLKKLEKSGKLDQWWTNNRKSLWSVPYLCSHHFWRAMNIRQIRAVVDSKERLCSTWQISFPLWLARIQDCLRCFFTQALISELSLLHFFSKLYIVFIFNINKCETRAAPKNDLFSD